MELLMDPSIWAGLLTLIVLEIVLGIDNLVFIAILADKLPPKQRDKARLIGLSLALVMRLGLLSVMDGDADEAADYYRRFLLFRA
jgi:predicted tellurium resistance membrane protein TerC